jgi:hypothetical protein
MANVPELPKQPNAAGAATAPRPPGSPVLVVGDRHLRLIRGRRFLVGSAREADVRLTHGSIEAAHAALEALPDGHVRVEDLSGGRTWLDGIGIQKADVRPTAVLRLGEIEVRIIPPTGFVVLPKARTPDSFRALMAHELRRAPWLTGSAAAHALLILLLATLWRVEVPEREKPLRLAVLPGEPIPPDEADPHDELDLRLDELTEPPMPDPLSEDLEAVKPSVDAEDTPDFDPVIPDPSNRDSPSIWNARVTLAGAGGLSTGDIDGSLAPTFRRTLHGLRKSGLDIVFVFDSTGSMGSVLKATKRHILRTVEVLRVLVPSAQVGVVTFRDYGQDEDYLLRSVPLESTGFRAMSFVRTITAWGGGDEPEAVLDGLQAAFRMNWEEGARRVVVLIGDAPPHERNESRLRRAIERFTKDGLGHVHTIVTGHPDIVSEATVEAFRWIAEAGNGEQQFLEDDDAVLRQVLGLAFGTEFRNNLEDVYRRVSEQGSRIPTIVLEQVRREDIEGLKRHLGTGAGIDSAARAIAQQPTRKLAEWLVSVVEDENAPSDLRHAASWCLCQIIDVDEPPIDPETGELLRGRLQEIAVRVRSIGRRH